MFFADHIDMFAPVVETVRIEEPWKPVALAHDQWPPNYPGVFAWRVRTLQQLRADPELLKSAKAYYKTHKAEFIMHWMDTYNPRKSGIKWVPFVFFTRQYEFIQFFQELDRDQEGGLVEKARDIGATWLACGYTVTCFLFDDDDATGWGSRKQDLVDNIGDPDSIFEKMRLLLRRLPDVFLPEGLDERKHLTFMKMINPENGATVTGESGDKIGRGGRKKRFLVDESAHVERAEKIESALGDNTNVQIHMSSVNGLGNLFHRRREAGMEWSPGCVIDPGYTRVFIFDWRHHPEKTQEWYDLRRAKYEREGLLHLFAQEVDRDYSAAIPDTIIPYEQLIACVDAHLKIPYLMRHPSLIPNTWMAGLDIADGGIDRNALALRQWIIVRKIEQWGARDPGATTRRAIAELKPYKGIQCQYDNIGMGTNVKSEYNRLIEDKIISTSDLQMIGWNAGAAVVNPFERIIPDDEESLMNKDYFGNFKAQAWFSMARRVYKTWRVIMSLIGEGPMEIYNPEELISFDGNMPLLLQLLKELAQPARAKSTDLRTIIDKKPDGMKSPDAGDACVMAFFPVPDTGGHAIIGSYSGGR